MSPDDLNQFIAPLLLLIILLFAALERSPVARRRASDTSIRGLTNIALYFANSTLLNLLLPAGIIAFSISQAPRGIVGLDLQPWIAIPFTLLIMDVCRYWEHRVFHQAHFLWHAHLVHHSDVQLDVTTSQRHHPLEALLSTGVSVALIYLLGLPAEGVAFYYLLAVVVSVVSHANIEFSPSVDRLLRAVFVTPGVHAIHHSDKLKETNSNYGIVLTLWDRVFGTYTRPDPKRKIHFGLEYFRDGSDRNLGQVLLQPFEHARPSVAFPGYIIAGFAVAVIAMWPTAIDMIRIWWGASEWQYAFLVLPMFVYLVGWEYREELRQEKFKPSLAGLLLAFPTLGLILFSDIMDVGFGKHLGLVLTFQAVLLGALGVSAFRKYLPLCLLLFLMVPYSDFATPVLRAATLWSIQTISGGLLGLDVVTDGFHVTVGEYGYWVLPECSGMIFFTLAVFLGYSLGLMIYRRLANILLLTLLCGLAALVANFLRVNAIIAMDLVNGTQADLAGHVGYRWMAFAVMFTGMFLVLRRTIGEGPEQGSKYHSSASGSGGGRRWAPLAAALPCLALALLLSSKDVDIKNLDTNNLAAFEPPTMLGGFRAQQSASSWARRQDRPATYSSLTYSDGESDFRVIAEKPLSNEVKIEPAVIRPDESRSWTRFTAQSHEACHESRCLAYEHHIWRLDNTEEIYNVYVSVWVGDKFTASKLRLRLGRGVDRLLGRSSRATMLAFASDDPVKNPVEVAARLLQVQSGLAPISTDRTSNSGADLVALSDG